MRSAKSFFNGAIARSDLRRYWPVLFLYVGLWLLFLPIPVWNRAAERNPALVNLTELCADTYATAVVLALIFGGIMATAVFSYLMQTRSVGAMHALPQRRGTLFWTHFLTGWAMLAAGNLLVLAVTALTALLGGLALTPALLTWFVVATLLDLIFLALGTLCAMVTGWLLAVPVLYAAVNCLAVALTWLGQQLYGRRKSELSGDVAAFSWMRPVFRLGVGLVGGLPLGMLLYVLVSVGRSGDFSPARLCVCMAVMGIVCYLAAAMLVGKTLRVLPKRLPGAAVTALVLVLLCVALRADVFGYADRTPQAEDVARARVYCLDTSFTLEDPRSLETLVKAQAELAENRAADMNYRMTFEVHYVLKDGTSMARCYRLAMTEPVKAALEQVARLEEVQTYVMFNGNVPPSGWQPTGGGLWLNAAGESRELTAEEAQALYDAAWRDVQAKNVLPVDGDYAWLGVEITLFRDGDSRTISATKSSYKELTQALLDLGIPAEDIGEINID